MMLTKPYKCVWGGQHPEMVVVVLTVVICLNQLSKGCLFMGRLRHLPPCPHEGLRSSLHTGFLESVPYVPPWITQVSAAYRAHTAQCSSAS